MVKGLARRVVVVKSPDKRMFEEAIFILREDALRDGGYTAEDVMVEACRVAAGYVRKNRRMARWLKPLAFAAAGLALVAAGVTVGIIFG